MDAALPRNAIMEASEAELAPVKAKLAAIGPGAVITKTDGRLDAVTHETFEARQKAPAPFRSRELTIACPPLQGEIIPPRRSMMADGGTPPKRYAESASIAEATAWIRAHAAEQARVNAETAHRLAALERCVEKQERAAAKAATWSEFAVRGIALLHALADPDLRIQP